MPARVAALRPLIPKALTIDTYDGQAYVGLVPFTVTGARPMLVPPLPWVSSFHEVNVRTYVHLDGRDPGVWFFSLDASNPVVVAAARALFLLPYHHARMELDKDEGGIEFRSARSSARRRLLPRSATSRWGRRSRPRPERSTTSWSSATSSTPPRRESSGRPRCTTSPIRCRRHGRRCSARGSSPPPASSGRTASVRSSTSRAR